MRLNQYLLSGKHLFDSLTTYPDYITSDVKTEVEEICLYDYGQRKIRPYIERLTKEEWQGGITPSLETVIQWAVLSFIKKWSYKYGVLFSSEGFTYNPIENYSMLEVMTDDTTDITYGRTDTRTLVKDSADTRSLDYSDERTADLTEETTPDLTDTHTLNSLTNTETAEIAGFDSSSFSDADRKTNVGTGSETNTSTGTTTTTTSGTDTMAHSGTDTMTHSGTDTDTNVQSGTDSHVRNYELTRTGNIGTVTAQDMIEQEREIGNFSAISEFAHDLVNAITIGVY